MTDRFALRHPVFWGALALLVANDHWLKGADLLPGWVTGKLSDFAGLIVAPIVLAALLRARTPRRRAVAYAIVGGWFTAANLFAPIAAGTATLASWVGLAWSFWVDPTDLVALAALPVAWQLHRPGRATPRQLGERLALGLGVAACVASPQPPPPGEAQWTASAFLVNGTERELDVRVSWVESAVDCDAIGDRVAEALPREAFGAGTVYTLAPRASLPIDRGLVDMTDLPGTIATPDPTPHLGSCDVALIQPDGLPETILFWDGLSPIAVPETIDDPSSIREGVVILDTDDGAVLSHGEAYVAVEPLPTWAGGSECAAGRSAPTFGSSELPRWDQDPILLTRVAPTVDGCLSLGVEDLDAPHPGGLEPGVHDVFLCVPPEDFPFEAGDELEATRSAGGLRLVELMGTRRLAELVLLETGAYASEGRFSAEVEPAAASETGCRGERLACGAFVGPSRVTVTLDGVSRVVEPGATIATDPTSAGRAARLRVGRAETLLVGHPDCGPERDAPGTRLQILISYAEELP